MTIILSPEETARWEESGWLSLEIPPVNFPVHYQTLSQH